VSTAASSGSSVGTSADGCSSLSCAAPVISVSIASVAGADGASSLVGPVRQAISNRASAVSRISNWLASLDQSSRMRRRPTSA